MKDRNKIKSEQLGMSFSTAQHRLRMMLMFRLVQECNRDICIRCNEKIEDVDNLSIEHITPWLHSEQPYDLFFDLENIAFSHRKCNYSHTSRTYNRKSGFQGVYFDKKNKSRPWRAVIQKLQDGKRHHLYLGSFETPKEAGRFYDEKVIEMYGENEVTNKSLGLL